MFYAIFMQNWQAGSRMVTGFRRASDPIGICLQQVGSADVTGQGRAGDL